MGESPLAITASSAISAAILKRNHRYIIMAAICVIVSAVVACAIDAFQLNAAIQNGTFVLLQPTGEEAPPLQTLIADRAQTLIFVSILTAIVEEIVFRGLLLRAFLKRLTERKTILITSGIFATLHMIPLGVPIGADAATSADPASALIALSLLLKGAQAFAFGIIMAKIVLRDGNLPIVMALHALFDTIYFAVPVLSTGAFPETYVAINPDQFLALTLSTLILLPPALKTRSAGLNAPPSRLD